jgi:hypothetical protein
LQKKKKKKKKKETDKDTVYIQSILYLTKKNKGVYA